MAKKAKKKRRTSKSSGSDVKSEMRRYKKGTAKSGRGGKGGKVKSKKQAIAIGLSKARKARRSPRKRSNGAICRHSAVTRHSGRLDVPCHAWRQVSRHMAQNFRVVRRPSTVAL